MIITEVNVPCVWRGTLNGILLKNDKASQRTMKFICIHGWLDNLNSMLPLAQKLVERHPNYEMCLYDRAGHGFSSHIPKGFDYSHMNNLRDLRTVIRTLGWHKEKFSIIGHSYGAILGMTYATSFRDDVLCFIAIDALLREHVSSELLWKTIGINNDKNLEHLSRPPKVYKDELTFEKAVEVIKSTRPGITDDAARLLTERSVRRGADNQLHFTPAEALKTLSLFPFVNVIIESAVRSITASVLFIGTVNPQWTHPKKTFDLFKTYNSDFEMTFIDGPHHLHMTHVDVVAKRIEEYLDKYLHKSSVLSIENSKL